MLKQQKNVLRIVCIICVETAGECAEMKNVLRNVETVETADKCADKNVLLTAENVLKQKKNVLRNVKIVETADECAETAEKCAENCMNEMC